MAGRYFLRGHKERMMNVTSNLTIQTVYDYLSSVPLSGKSLAWTALNAGIGKLVDMTSPATVLTQGAVSALAQPLFEKYGLELEDYIRNSSLSNLEGMVKWAVPLGREYFAIKTAGLFDGRYGVDEYINVALLSLLLPATLIITLATALKQGPGP